MCASMRRALTKAEKDMIERFLKYSLEREKKICAVLIAEGQMVKKNLLVTGIDEDGDGADDARDLFLVHVLPPSCPRRTLTSIPYSL